MILDHNVLPAAAAEFDAHGDGGAEGVEDGRWFKKMVGGAGKDGG